MTSRSKLLTLEEWGRAKFGDHAPNKDTLRRWARETKIHPAPQKVGRTYLVSEDAEYVDDYSEPSSFMRRVRESATA